MYFLKGSSGVKRWRCLVAVVLFLLFSLPTSAQQPVGSISGNVTDSTGGAVPGATVTATSKSTGAGRSATSNEAGFYLIPTLLPGEYKLTIEMGGFAGYIAERVVVEVGQSARVDAALQVKGITDVVQVTEAGAGGVETTQSTVGGVVNVRQIDELPLNGRNYLELAKLQPGIEIQEGSSFDPTKSRYTGISIGGRNGREARITIDGIDAVDEHVGTTTLNISQDSIQEFQLSTAGSDASAGLSATGAVNVITRRGGNDLHGSGFVFGRGARYAARPSFDTTKPPFDREQYGFNLGGPLRRDRIFGFANFEKTRERSAIGLSTPYFSGLTTYPAPFDERSSTARIDWRLPRQNEFFFRWSRNDNSNFGGFGGSRLPSTGNVNTNLTNQYVGGLDTVLSSHLTNGFRVALTNFKNRVISPPEAARQVTVPGVTGFRIVTSDGLLTTGPDNITPQSTFELFGQFRDDLTYSMGNHTWRFGGDVVRRKVTVTNFVFGFPSFNVAVTGAPDPATLLDLPFTSVSLGNRNGKRIPGTRDNSLRNTRLSWYMTDSWRARPNFTLNYGIRYEADTLPLNNDLNKPDLIRTLLPNGVAPTPINKHNFAPQLGFAWDPFRNGKTSIRAGFGLYYAMRISNLVTNERASLAPFNSGNDTITLTPNPTSDPNRDRTIDFTRDGRVVFNFTPALIPGTTVRNALPTISAGQSVYVGVPPSTQPGLQVLRQGTIITNDLTTPYSQQFNAGVQRELPSNVVLDVNFIYSRTVHEFMRDVDLANFFPGNGPPRILGDGLPPNGQITLITSDGFSRYRALTVRADKRFSRRYQLTASYALARLETSTADGLGLGAGALVNRNVKANFGSGALDRTHRLTVNGIVELPYGFRLSLITTMNSGLPTSILVGSADLNGDGINGDLLPGTRRGSLGREVHTTGRLNELIRNYNRTVGGSVLPRGGNAPFLLEVPDKLAFGDSFISHDLQVSKVFRITERVRLEATAQMFNVFNVSNLVGPAGLPSTPFNGTLTTIASTGSGVPVGSYRLGSDGRLLNAAGNRALAGVDARSGFAGFSAVRPSIPTGTGLPRASQFGLKLIF